MKNLSLIGLILISLTCLSFDKDSTTPPKVFTFTFTEAQLNKLYNGLDQSNAPHSDIKEIQNIISIQYSKQLQDTSKVK